MPLQRVLHVVFIYVRNIKQLYNITVLMKYKCFTRIGRVLRLSGRMVVFRLLMTSGGRNLKRRGGISVYNSHCGQIEFALKPGRNDGKTALKRHRIMHAPFATGNLKKASFCETLQLTSQAFAVFSSWEWNYVTCDCF